MNVQIILFLNETIAAHDQIILLYYTNLILILLIQKLLKNALCNRKRNNSNTHKKRNCKNPNANRAKIVNHISKQGKARRTIYNNINKLGTLQPKKDLLHGHLLNIKNSKDW